MHILAPYSSARKSGFVLGVPKVLISSNSSHNIKSAQNRITFKVSQPDIYIKIDPCHQASQYQEDKKSCVSAIYPPTRSLSVQWTENKGTDATKVK